ncbi:hypothetical protein ABW54_22810 [Burkholderia cenocepacia]|nr:hypothetical protein ABW54_22810 [Burkholderia cenocepacia]
MSPVVARRRLNRIFLTQLNLVAVLIKPGCKVSFRHENFEMQMPHPLMLTDVPEHVLAVHLLCAARLNDSVFAARRIEQPFGEGIHRSLGRRIGWLGSKPLLFGHVQQMHI